MATVKKAFDEGLGLFRQKPNEVRAIQLAVLITIDTPRGPVKAKPGDWLLQQKMSHGRILEYTYSDSEFKANFEAVAEPAPSKPSSK
jgi:hypothetical protein